MRALALRPDDAILRLRRLLARGRPGLAGDAGQERRCHERPDGVPPGPGEDPASRGHRPRRRGAHGPRARARRRGYFTGIIRCWYGVPGHITYGLCGLSAVFG